MKGFHSEMKLKMILRGALVMAAALVIGGAAMAQDNISSAKNLAIFPFENTTSAGDQALGQDIATALRTWSRMGNVYIGTVFASNTPTMQRAKQERRLADADLQVPFDTVKAAKVGKEMAADVSLIGSIDDYRYDANAKEVQITLTAQLVSTKNGEELKTVAATGTGKATASITEENGIAGLAVQDAIGKISQSLGFVKTVNAQSEKKAQKAGHKKNSNKTKAILFVLGAGAIAAAATN